MHLLAQLCLLNLLKPGGCTKGQLALLLFYTLNNKCRLLDLVNHLIWQKVCFCNTCNCLFESILVPLYSFHLLHSDSKLLNNLSFSRKWFAGGQVNVRNGDFIVGILLLKKKVIICTIFSTSTMNFHTGASLLQNDNSCRLIRDGKNGTQRPWV